MWKRIEQHIKDHREEIDRDVPGPEVWNNIEKALNPTAKVKKLGVWRYLQAAAMILVAVGAGYWWSIINPGVLNLNNQASFIDGIHLIDSSHSIPEMEDVEAIYAMKFSDRMEQIKQYDLKGFPATEDFKEDLAQVDECIKALKSDIEKEGLHEQIIKAMVKNFDQKITILDQFLTQLEKVKKANSIPPA